MRTARVTDSSIRIHELSSVRIHELCIQLKSMSYVFTVEHCTISNKHNLLTFLLVFIIIKGKKWYLDLLVLNDSKFKHLCVRFSGIKQFTSKINLKTTFNVQKLENVLKYNN